MYTIILETISGHKGNSLIYKQDPLYQTGPCIFHPLVHAEKQSYCSISRSRIATIPKKVHELNYGLQLERTHYYN
jgi:hypothetical protein